ncbi:tryptophan--tRNA ligase [Comamonas testosteroni]|uniref:Tryptophan--tRNA ligase n=1 Tax=Comamonas testosteroni (strain DSM 14576 / KF-1) TaxID=399795 RepID=B7WTV9_COMTK|nr:MULTISPECIES: tryptophan--tRNA ligase [Comamonas]EED69230.1 tryptophanyl-tRNA synthetase [Comamonas testosteroni KF-1]TYK72474.1 tryptophan--tRNA ligase [Comamonas sp. Z3]WQG67214.1 tryptophan--tRNA ligase [Comamonas testosteroni]
MSTTRFLTGITPSGTPHLGNYAGMMRPAIEASRDKNVENFYFLADYHALIKCQDPERVQRSTIEIAASWLAAGLDPEHVTFYRQSDIPEIPELTWFLTCVTGKGLLNRAHAYKAAVDKNNASGTEPDDGVTAGLFMYPVLMGADILIFNASKVPVGRDQVQHLEMARDMASSFNHIYGSEYFTLPEAVVEESVATLPGLDGRKMSKSYNNTIPLFAPREQLRKLINSITTDSRAPGEAKEVEGSALFQIYQGFASEEESAALRQQYAEGIAWGDAKQILFARIDREIAPMRERYEYLIAHPAELEEILQAGAVKARKLATPLLQQLRAAVGIRNLAQASKAKAKVAKTALPQFKQYRETDGQFYFKLVAADGQLLLQSLGFAAPKEAGQSIAQLQREGATALAGLKPRLQTLADVSDDQVIQALEQLREAAEQ